MQFCYQDKIYPVVIERKLGQKNTYIRVKNDLAVHVTTGRLTTKHYISMLLSKSHDKIGKMIAAQEEKLENNSGFFYLGKKYNIIYKDIDKLVFDGDNVYFRKNFDIEKWYKKQAKILFLEHLEEKWASYSRKIPHPTLRIRKMTTRWGVCNTKTHVITLNLELIKRDCKYLDYVIIHELTHLVHADHSKYFWSTVEENMKEYKKYRNEMKNFL